jgi:hypothetical protein
MEEATEFVNRALAILRDQLGSNAGPENLAKYIVDRSF